MRLRLRCSTAFSLGDLQWSMVHVPDHVRTAGDLAGHISRLLDLNLRGGGAHLPQLLLDGFLIPHGEDVRQVLRDDEVLDVEPGDGSAVGGALILAIEPAPTSGKRLAAAVPAGAEAAAPKAKKQRQADGGLQAIGWQGPAAAAAHAAGAGRKAAAAAPPVVAKAKAPVVRQKAPSSSSEEESDDEDDDESEEAAPQKQAAKAKGRGRGGGAAGGAAGGGAAACGGRAAAGGQEQTESASEAAAAAAASVAARAAALATCGKGVGEGGGGRGSGEDTGCGLFVGGLPLTVDDDALKTHFESYGAVSEASVCMNPKTGRSKGYGFVEYERAVSRVKALAAGPKQQFAGKLVEVKAKAPKGGKGDGAEGKGGKGEGKGAKGEGKNGKSAGKAGSKAAAAAALPAPAAAPAEAAEEGDEEAEMMRQMAAMGLPVSFTASIDRGNEEDEDSDEDEDDEEE